MVEILFILLGFMVRLLPLLIEMDHFVEFCEHYPGFSTPLDNWRSVKEAIFLKEMLNRTSPTNHEIPMMLNVYEWLGMKDHRMAIFVMAFLDVVGCIVLVQFVQNASLVLKREDDLLQSKSITKYRPIGRVSSRRLMALAISMLNPMNIGTVYAKSTSTVHCSFLGSLTLFLAIKGFTVLSMFPLALLTVSRVYPIVLLLPIATMFKTGQTAVQIIRSVGAFMVSALVLILINHCNSLLSIWKFILTIPDQTPNLGIWWYVFCEMFDQYRSFSLIIFHSIILVSHVIPLYLTLRHYDLVYLFVMLMVSSFFNPYPSFGQISIYVNSSIIWIHLLNDSNKSHFALALMTGSVFVMPIVYNAWIMKGTMNANFYFAATATFMLSQVLFVVDIAFASLKRRYQIIHGSVDEDGKAKKVLKLS
ncbi:hypothetical protein ACOME3_000956 [Neoechinorhynchus agilis]